MNLPEQFLKRMEEGLGTEFPAFLRSYDFPAARALRVNTLKISPDRFQKISPFSLTPVPWEENGFYAEAEKLGAHRYHFAGLYYCQEPSAMCAAPLLQVRAGERVLDLCAAPGGKSTQLAQSLAGEGLLVANEYVPDRAKILSQNIERLGVKNCFVVNADAAALAAAFPAYFDKVLVDAPCSGEGMFKKEEAAVREWSEENVKRCAARQREILTYAARTVKPGGRMVYSTCTFSPEENEGQIETFLRKHSDFKLISEEKLLPHMVRGEGHFAALLERTDGESVRQKKPFAAGKNASSERAFRAFCAESGIENLGGEITTLSDGRMYLLPEGAPDLSGVKVLRAGVELGEWDQKIFKPAHALAMSLRSEHANSVELSEAESERYLHGETVPCEVKNGWYLACTDGFPLGWGKAVNGTFKNHLPKGLRKIK